MPVGPKERGDWWYANARLAYRCLGIVAWGPVMGGHDQAAKTCYFSRVTSKKAEYTVACVTYILFLRSCRFRPSRTFTSGWTAVITSVLGVFSRTSG